jgi:hypothetical protein
MTVNLEEIVPSKAKTWVGLVGSVVTFVAPLVLSVSDALPSPWSAVIGAVLAVLTALGIYKAPYLPPETVVVPESVATGVQLPPSEGEYRNPWPHP